jgi:NAD(P)H-dependent FMN reductase
MLPVSMMIDLLGRQLLRSCADGGRRGGALTLASLHIHLNIHVMCVTLTDVNLQAPAPGAPWTLKGSPREQPQDRDHPGQHPSRPQRQGCRRLGGKQGEKPHGGRLRTGRPGRLPAASSRHGPSAGHGGQHTGEHPKAWAAKIGGYDGFIFVTPEYNHSTSGVQKNAIDYLQAEWNNKAAGFVSYGAIGGARAIEHLRGILSELQVAHVRQQLSFSLFSDFENLSVFNPGPQHDDIAEALFAQLEAWSGALKPLRS